MSPADPAIVADDVTIRYGRRRSSERPAVAGVSFVVPSGEILAVVGEAGAGKSTLARALAGQVGSGTAASPEISGGSLRVLGTELRGIGRRAWQELTFRIGYLPQDGGSKLQAQLTVGENVAQPIYLRDRRFDQHQAGAAVATLLDAVRLPLAVMGHYPHELSRGQRQRVALARALILEPRLLIADDPTSGVDPTVADPVLEAIRDIQRQRNLTAVVIGQDLRGLGRLAQNIAVMQRGMIVGLGSITSVLSRPEHPYVQRLADTIGGDEP